jgi:hypothetical protein
MKTHSKLRPMISLPALLLLLAAAYLVHHFRGEADAITLSPSNEDSSSSSVNSLSASVVPVRGPRLAMPTMNPSPLPQKQDQHITDAGLSRSAREEAARKERSLMAKTWGMSDEQYQKFEAAATAVPLERKAVYERHFKGELASENLEKELEQADAHDSKQLREILGQHYQEYTLMRGHFAEAGLDHEPFVPPVLARPLQDPQPSQGP